MGDYRKRDNRKNDEHARIERRQRVAELYLRGKSQMAIAAELGCSQPTVSLDLQAIREQWLSSTLVAFNEKMAAELAKLDNLEAEAWEAWERSLKDAETHHQEIEKAKAAKGKGLVVVKEMIRRTTKGQVGDPRFLETVYRCIDARMKLCELYDVAAKLDAAVGEKK